jgi:hypothetical protein
MTVTSIGTTIDLNETPSTMVIQEPEFSSEDCPILESAGER